MILTCNANSPKCVENQHTHLSSIWKVGICLEIYRKVAESGTSLSSHCGYTKLHSILIRSRR
jgi:hypothetical protein